MTRPKIALAAERPASLLTARLESVRASLLELERAVNISQFGAREDSARNLLHYLAFRRFDLRRDQALLAESGLSSLGRSEGHVLYNLDSVLRWLYLKEPGHRKSPTGTSGPSPERGQALLEHHLKVLLGPSRSGRSVRIMVTLPTEAASDQRLVNELVASGMDCARINCAHDSPDVWAKMVAGIHRAERATGHHCKIEMDLAGPKIRTGAIKPGPPVMKIRPKRDPFGHVTSPACLWLVPTGHAESSSPDYGVLAVDGDWLSRRLVMDRIKLIDARGAKRTLRIVERVGDRCRCELTRTAYVTTGTTLVFTGAKKAQDSTSVSPIAPLEQRILLQVGDRLMITAKPLPGEPAWKDERGRVVKPAHISCTLPEGIGCVRSGESIWLDDGKIGGVVRSATPARLVVEISHAEAGGAWLGADKGINLPDTALSLNPITQKDLADLRIIVKLADIIGYSFVHSAADLELLREKLKELGRPRMGVVVKVETRRGFEELPGMLLSALREPPVGIMIARGDLAVEVGFDRLAEVQEEILWLCEAAHTPTIWATQVLEGMAKTGLPSRAEVTDAAMGERAECVMLNKGPHVVEAVKALDSILRRMQSHQAKKMAMLRHLELVERFTRQGYRSGNVWVGKALTRFG